MRDTRNNRDDLGAAHGRHICTLTELGLVYFYIIVFISYLFT